MAAQTSLWLFCLFSFIHFNNGVDVVIESGVQIQGSQMTTFNGREFLAFRGIPYAEPPLGELRFKPPFPKKWTTDSFDATKLGAECSQYNFFLQKNPGVRGNEDCLFLNVYTPQVSKSLKKVMVFIHGGGFIMGSGGVYGPNRLLDHDLVLVTINYRLGAMGFLSTLDDALPGNYGLMDQTEALKWVRKNIEAFGGDPNKVTIFGESAGAASVFNHVIAPASKGLFQRAIAQSGNLLCPWAEQKNPIHWTNVLAEKLGCSNKNTQKLVECLRTIPAQKLTQESSLDEKIPTPFGPVKDGYFLRDLASNLLRRGEISNPVPILLGVTKEEGVMFSMFEMLKHPGHKSTKDLLQNLAKYTLNTEQNPLPDGLLELLKKQYFKNDVTDEAKVLEILTRIVSDGMFNAPHFETIKLLISHGINPFLYSFNYVTDRSITKLLGTTALKGPTHVDDLFFLFDMKMDYVVVPPNFNTPNDETENKFLDIWLNFAENGYPAEKNGKAWKPARLNDVTVYHLDDPITSETYDLNHDWRPDFWLNKVPKIMSKTQTKNKEEL